MSALSHSGRSVDYGPFRAVPALIEGQADLAPERPAVSHDGRTLSYGMLDQLANGLAAELAQRGVGRGDTVPVLLINSLELPVSYFALMKLGAVFVPLDPAWPEAQVRTILETLGPKAVLCASARHVPGDDHRLAVVVNVDRIVPTGVRPGVELLPGEPVYGFFTSGTTGRPKCAMNLHGGLANRFEFMTRYFEATGEEVVLQNSKHTFDSSVWQLLWPLTTGSRTILPIQQRFLDLIQTVNTIEAHGITACDFVSSIFNTLVTLVDNDPAAVTKLRSLRWLVVGSEPVNPAMVRRLTSLLPGLKVTNGYGPTETSIGMAFHPMSESDGDSVPVGRPIDNCYAVIVDEGLRPVPQGDIGEIAVGGACMGAGYFGAPSVTASVFVPNPFTAWIPGDRLYLTGDLGRLDEQGRLFLSGRKDFQVKIGGVRIEPGEIEQVAERCRGVRQAQVLVAGRDNAKSLALFAVCDPEVTEETVRAWLRSALPHTSLPRHVLLLPAMPLSDNGKADRTELQHLLERRLAADAVRLSQGVAPPGLEGLVLWVMRAALERPDFGPDEHFMDAGGDSLKALVVINSVRAEMDLPQLCVQDLFDQPTAARLAMLIENYRSDRAVNLSEVELMEQDAALAPLEVPRYPDQAADLRTVLVTGATGFVGSRVVHELLRTTDLRVIALVRAGDDERARGRVVTALAERDLWDPQFADRLEGCAGDLSLPSLGLPTATWGRLAGTADLVLNCGAMVNFLFDYRAHRRANVLGVHELLRLAAESRPVPVHQVSTTAALQSSTDIIGPGLAEDCDVEAVDAPPGGYNRSKWVAERYLDRARRRGAAVTLLRLGEVMPSTDTGMPNPVALTHLLLSSFVRLGVRPRAEIRSDFTPVDYAAKRIVAAVLDREIWGSTLNILHPGSRNFACLLDDTDEAPREISCRDYLASVDLAAAQSGERELVALSALLPDPSADDEAGLRRGLDHLLTDNAALYRRDNCQAAEQRWRLDEPVLDDAIAAYAKHLVDHYRMPGRPR
ncbi:amino acid adenylation domain-containing protein/thioester reductase-like protein [Catenulispora sp. GAS73]|uniref:non-ribosomal peptide synthetase n=1 Tax=Catenulispora sp. GAS73 TaxID=3156269 RepID=UPI003513BB0C